MNSNSLTAGLNKFDHPFDWMANQRGYQPIFCASMRNCMDLYLSKDVQEFAKSLIPMEKVKLFSVVNHLHVQMHEGRANRRRWIGGFDLFRFHSMRRRSEISQMKDRISWVIPRLFGHSCQFIPGGFLSARPCARETRGVSPPPSFSVE